MVSSSPPFSLFLLIAGNFLPFLFVPDDGDNGGLFALKNLGIGFVGMDGEAKMHLLVVAAVAVAEAGCLGKYWNRLSNNGDSSPQLYSNYDNPDSPRHELGNSVSSDRRASDVDSVDSLLTSELAKHMPKWKNMSHYHLPQPQDHFLLLMEAKKIAEQKMMILAVH